MKPNSSRSPNTLSTQGGMPGSLQGVSALVIAHPGHELRVYGWLQAAHPTVFVLTDGSGRTGQSRLASTTALLEEARAGAGSIYGRLTDLDFYRAVLDHRFELFETLAEELARELELKQPRYVVGDALEGYNPAHDACRMIINTGVRIAERRLDREIANFDFSLIDDPSSSIDHNGNGTVSMRLDEATHSRKLSAAAAYTALAKDVGKALGSFGTEAFQLEHLRPVDAATSSAGLFDGPPFYEQYGEKQVAAGYYDRVLRHRQHMSALSDALNAYVEQRA